MQKLYRKKEGFFQWMDVIDEGLKNAISGLIPIKCHFSIASLHISGLTNIEVNQKKNKGKGENEIYITTTFYFPPTNSGNTIFIHRSPTCVCINTLALVYSDVVKYRKENDSWLGDIVRIGGPYYNCCLNEGILNDPEEISDRVKDNLDNKYIRNCGYDPRPYILLNGMLDGDTPFDDFMLFCRVMNEIESIGENYTMIINSVEANHRELIEFINNRELPPDTKIFVIGENGPNEYIDYLLTN